MNQVFDFFTPLFTSDNTRGTTHLYSRVPTQDTNLYSRVPTQPPRTTNANRKAWITTKGQRIVAAPLNQPNRSRQCTGNCCTTKTVFRCRIHRDVVCCRECVCIFCSP